MLIWASQETRDLWKKAISEKAVLFFEKLATADNAEQPKTKDDHAHDTGIAVKYIERATLFFLDLGLLSRED